jgi:hypothetical protein
VQSGRLSVRTTDLRESFSEEENEVRRVHVQGSGPD